MIEKLLNLCNTLTDKLNMGDRTMDIEGFLLASGFALLIVLLGWANQITSKSKETKDLEKEFLEKAKLKKDDYKKIVNEKGATEDSFVALVEFLYSNKEEHLQIFENIKHVKVDLKKLDKKYSCRFWILLGMSISLFVTGAFAFCVSNEYDFLALIPNLIFTILVFINLVSTYMLEKRYTRNISESMENI